MGKVVQNKKQGVQNRPRGGAILGINTKDSTFGIVKLDLEDGPIERAGEAVSALIDAAILVAGGEPRFRRSCAQAIHRDVQVGWHGQTVDLMRDVIADLQAQAQALHDECNELQRQVNEMRGHVGSK